MDHGGHQHGMGDMAPPPMHGMGDMAPPTMHGGGMPNMNHMMMHMTFFWGKNAEILFSGWPGTRSGMYALALIVGFVLAVIVEWLSHCNLIKDGSNHVAAGLIQTLMHAIRIGLAYMVMLAVMSFNVGVFIVAVAGHTLGFFLFGSRFFKKSSPPQPPSSGKTSDLPPMSC